MEKHFICFGKSLLNKWYGPNTQLYFTSVMTHVLCVPEALYLEEAGFGPGPLWPFHLESFVPRAMKACVLCVQQVFFFAWLGVNPKQFQQRIGLPFQCISSVRS